MPIHSIRVFHWDTSAMLLFAGAESPMHEHVAMQLALGVDGDARVELREHGWQVAPALLVPQGMPHAYDGREGDHCVLWIEPESLVGRAIRARYPRDTVTSFGTDEVAALRAVVRGALDGTLGPVEATLIRQRLVELVTGGLPPDQPAPDPRLRRVIDLMLERRAEDLSVVELARLASMSESSLSHLFREQIGVPVSRYRMWLRTLEAMRLMSESATVTDAAHGAGFSDAAHLSRTFKKLIGQSPRATRDQLLEIHAIDSDYGA